MTVTDVRLKLKTDGDRLKAFGSITLDGELVINGIKVILANDGHCFVGFPSRTTSAGEYKDICFPLNKGLREEITTKVLADYELQLQEQAEERAAKPRGAGHGLA